MGRLTRLLLLCAIISACSKPNEVENPDQTVVVEAYLTPGRDPLVKLRNTLPPEQFFEGLEDTLTEAEVRILVDDQTFVLSEIPAGSGFYSISSTTLPIVSGKTYTLEVDSPDASPVRARTTVPFTAEVTAVVGDTITYQQSFSEGFGSLHGLTAADSWKEVHLAVAGDLAPHPLVVDLSIHRHGHPWF